MGFCTLGKVGSEDRIDYTIGGGANLAARVESRATPSVILIFHETYALVKDQAHCEEHGEISVNGIAYPVSSYQVVGLDDNISDDDRLIREHHTNLQLDLNIRAMPAGERRQSSAVSRQALDSVSDFDTAANPFQSNNNDFRFRRRRPEQYPWTSRTWALGQWFHWRWVEFSRFSNSEPRS